ncbi:putative hemagglutinin-related autotransporter protein [Burkholderia lata]|nr:putative hemagglutinin-related autotransporter protein [Burkholderia lata]
MSTSTSTAIEAAKTHYYSVNDGGAQGANYANSAATGMYSLAAGVAANAAGASSVAVGYGSNAQSDGAVAIGQSASATGGKAVSIGSGNTASGDGAVAIGDPSIATGTGAVAMGADDTATGTGAVALGNASTATGNSALALGNSSQATADNTIALGNQATASAIGAQAYGSGATASAANALALGSNATANVANSIALGANSVTGNAVGVSSVTVGGVTYAVAGANPVGVLSVGSPGAERQITNVAAGRVSATSTDAINGSQLNATNSAVSTLSTGLNATNSNVTALATSTSTAISSLSTSTAASISALSTGLNTTNASVASLSTGVTNINNQLNQLSTLMNNTPQTGNAAGIAADMNGTGIDKPTVTAGSNSVAIGANSSDGGRQNVVSVGSDTQQRQVINVAPGTQGTDAVNVNQLNAVQSTLSTALSGQQAQINSLGSQLQQTDQMAKQGIAAVGAMASIPQLDRDANFGMGVGTSTFLGQKAMAVNMQARITDNLKASINGGFSGGQKVIGAGMLYQWK